MASQRLMSVLTLLYFTGVNGGEDGPGPMVDTSSGRIVGLYTDQAKVFRSIPYARPPIGELRWKDPQRVLPVPGILQTTEDPPGCPQLDPCDLPSPQFTCPHKISEDCLYLNIFTPRNAEATSNLPVMVFIHGGNFIRGYSGGLLYDGQYIANTTATVVVTVNYRLGAIGFLVFGEEEGTPAGNYGLRDQRMALEWVQENIKGFGGNPNEVTLWGQSAGAISVSVHMSSIKSAGLFNKAIIESNPFGLRLKDIREARKLGKDFAREIGCKDLDCLYKKNITEIANAQEAVESKIIDLKYVLEVFLQWTPVVDYNDLFDQPIFLLLKGQIAPMPMIVGTTSEESRFFIYQAFTSPVSVEERDAVEFAIFPKDYRKLAQFYPASEGDNRPGLSVIGTDFSFTCSTRYAVWGGANNTQRREAWNPTWLYVFNHSFSFDPWGKEFDYCNGHSCHSVELPFVFHPINMGDFKPSPIELNLSSNMTRYWTNFARNGNPNDLADSHREEERLPDWPEYYVDEETGTEQASCMKFRTPSSEVISDYHGESCSFWDSLGYNV